jgi:hypothetical protein
LTTERWPFDVDARIMDTTTRQVQNIHNAQENPLAQAIAGAFFPRRGITALMSIKKGLS